MGRHFSSHGISFYPHLISLSLYTLLRKPSSTTDFFFLSKYWGIALIVLMECVKALTSQGGFLSDQSCVGCCSEVLNISLALSWGFSLTQKNVSPWFTNTNGFRGFLDCWGRSLNGLHCSSEKEVARTQDWKEEVEYVWKDAWRPCFSRSIVLSWSVFPNSTGQKLFLLHFISWGSGVELFCNHHYLLLQDFSVFPIFAIERTLLFWLLVWIWGLLSMLR